MANKLGKYCKDGAGPITKPEGFYGTMKGPKGIKGVFPKTKGKSGKATKAGNFYK